MMPVIIDTRVPRHTGLNRTFYGIEKQQQNPAAYFFSVLIVPFMELKIEDDGRAGDGAGLNRTFYGIEITKSTAAQSSAVVLIVPFMELKL